MAQTSSVRDLVDRLESHLYADEREFSRALQITSDISDDALDELFLGDTFDRTQILKQFSVTNLPFKTNGDVTQTNPGQSDEAAEGIQVQQDTYLRQVE